MIPDLKGESVQLLGIGLPVCGSPGYGYQLGSDRGPGVGPLKHGEHSREP